MKQILIITNDCQDARFHKRVRSYLFLGYRVKWCGFRRKGRGGCPDDVLSLNLFIWGETEDKNYLNRLYCMCRAFLSVIRNRKVWNDFFCIHAINLDNLVISNLIKYISQDELSLVYECADIQPIMLGRGPLSRLLRNVERGLILRSMFIVTTSYKFIDNYFYKYNEILPDFFLLENKIFPRISSAKLHKDRGLKENITIGYFGAFRCRRSLLLIDKIAKLFNGKIVIKLRGYPNSLLSELFNEIVDNNMYLLYEGAYDYPNDLHGMYDDVDYCWGFDFSDEGGNSKMLLPNRLYESMAFGVPILSEKETYLGEIVARDNLGWVFSGSFYDELISFFSSIDSVTYDSVVFSIKALDESFYFLESDLFLLKSKIDESDCYETA